MAKESKKTSVTQVPLKNLFLNIEELEISAQQKAELDSLYDDLSTKFQTGKVIKGVVLNRDNSGVLVDINYKSNGLIPNYEFTEFELKKINVGEPVEVLLDRLEDESGCVVLSYQKAKSIKAWDTISEYAASDEPVRGVVTHKVKGGLSVDIGIPAFLPGSQVDIQRVTDFDQFVGVEVTCKILKVNRKRGNVIVSRRKFLEEQRLEDKKRIMEEIQDGQVLQGVVKNITNYGAFVDIGGVDGLLHITDMSWGRINHPSELLKIGDTITVKVISFDKKHEKISLGLKQLSENPWDQVEKKYPLGSKLTGNIASITDYGLFVEVEKGIEGLVHISEISWTERISNLGKHFTVGTKIDVAVVAIDKENRRMSLSVKQLKDDPWKLVAERFKVSEKISGKITNTTDFGLFVQLLDGVDGLVHVSDISWTEHITHPGDRFKKGDLISAVILSMDTANKKISLGIKQLEKDPWETIEQEYAVGKVVEGTVSKVASFGAFVKLASGIEGLVHISELSNKEVEKTEDILKVGQVEQFKVIKVNREERKLGLSLKALKEKPLSAKPSEEPAAKAVAHERPSESSEKKQKSVEQTAKPARENRAHKEASSMTGSPIKSSLQQALQDFKEQQTSDAEKNG